MTTIQTTVRRQAMALPASAGRPDTAAVAYEPAARDLPAAPAPVAVVSMAG